jgi:hypothetical protein
VTTSARGGLDDTRDAEEMVETRAIQRLDLGEERVGHNGLVGKSRRCPGMLSHERSTTGRYHPSAMADQQELSLDDQLKEIGAQLDWVRGYL